MRETVVTHPIPAPGRGRPPVSAVARRWPTGVAVAFSLIGLAGAGDLAGTVGSYGEVLFVLPLIYLIVNQSGRPGASWPVLGVLVSAMLALQALDVVSPLLVMVSAALVLLVWGVVGGTPHGHATFGVQAAGMLAFGAVAAVGLALDPDIGVYIVAAGWLLHGVWDFVHLKFDRVVSRTYAEWCGVYDILVAAELLFLTLTR
jgi:hypothetical protein